MVERVSSLLKYYAMYTRRACHAGERLIIACTCLYLFTHS